MSRTIRFTALLVLAVSAPAVSQNIDLGRLLKGTPIQHLPVNLGARLDLDYTFQSRTLNYGLAGEILFPIYGLLRCRATILQIGLSGTSAERISFNTGTGLDLLISFTRKRARLHPYGLLGGDLTLVGSNFDYGLKIGLGLEGRLQKSLALFGELGFSHSYRQAQAADALLGQLGIRLGR
ncbi:MAG: hypothetical protein ABIK43_01245 [candidate division WOR-3 bacterium]